MSHENPKKGTTVAWISNIITIVQFCGVILSAAIALYTELSLPAKICAGVISGLLFIVLVCRLLIRLFRIRILQWLIGILTTKGQISKQNKLVQYTYTSRESMFVKVQYYAKVNFGSCTHVVEKIKWSAGNTDQIEPIVKGQSIEFVEELNDVQANLGYQFFHVKFPKSRSAKDTPIFTGFRTKELLDSDKKSRTCLIAGIYEKTNCITLRVDFPPDLKVTNIRKLKYAHYVDLDPYDVENAEILVDEDNRHYIEFVVPNPIMGGKYAIDWDFIDSP